MRERESGLFMSQIPEDVKETLMNYLLYARLNDDECAAQPSFKAVMEKFDERVGVIFVKALMHLVDCYVQTLESVAWGSEIDGTTPPINVAASPGSPVRQCGVGTLSLNASEQEVSDMMEERLEYLCSATNDLRRIDQDTMWVRSGPLVAVFSRDSVVSAAASASARLSLLALKVSHSISCVIMRIICTEPLWITPNAHSSWLHCSNGSSEIAGDASGARFGDQMTDLGDLLDSKMDYLDAFCMYQVLASCAFKVVGRYLHLLRMAQESHRAIVNNSPEMRCLVEDVQAIKNCFSTLTDRPELAQYGDTILAPVKVLEQAMVLITFDRGAQEFEETLKSVLKVSQSHPQHALAFARFVECCLCFRDDRPRAPVPPPTPSRRPSVLSSMTSMLSSAATAATAAATHATGALAPPTPTAARRGSEILTIEHDPLSASILDEIRDSYDPAEVDDDVVRAAGSRLNNPVSHIFDDDPRFTLEHFLYGARRPDAAIHSSKSLMGSMLSLLAGAGGNSSPLTPSSAQAPLLAAPENGLPEHGGFSRSRICISGLSCNNLLCFAGKPRAFLMLSVDGVCTKTAMVEGTAPSWPQEVDFWVSDLSTRRSGLQVSLYYMGRIYGDECVATLSVPIDSLEMSSMENETFKFDAWKSPKAQAAADRAVLLGQDLPTMTISIRLA
jgi:hypothetical protein